MIQQAIKLLELLSDNRIHSGVELGAQLGVSRAAVWKLVQKMQQNYGVDISSVNGIGYCLAHPLPLLNSDQIQNLLVGYKSNFKYPKIVVLNSVVSTNDVALTNAARGAPNLSVWLAEHQTAGRGRRGKAWISPLLGNIYCSVLWRLSGGAPALEGLSLVIGLALAESLSEQGVHNVQLKWPNDLWVEGKKLGGILIEITGDPYADCAAVIGIGINVRLSEQVLSTIDQPITSLDQHIVIEDRNRIVAMLLNKISNVLDEHRQFGFPHFSERWSIYDALVGRSVNIIAGESITTGICRGVSSRGALMLDTASGTIEVYSGEVSVRPS